MSNTDDCYDDWEAAEIAGLPPKPVAGLLDAHEQNRRIWEEANRGERCTIVYQDEFYTPYVPEIKILRRPANANSGRSTADMTATRTDAAATATPSLDMRQRAYEEARRRIFGEATPDSKTTESASSSGRSTPNGRQNARTRGKPQSKTAANPRTPASTSPVSVSSSGKKGSTSK